MNTNPNEGQEEDTKPAEQADTSQPDKAPENPNADAPAEQADTAPDAPTGQE